MKRGFASDNNSGVSAEVLELIQSVNQGHEVGYGNDKYTEKALLLFKEHFGPESEAFLFYRNRSQCAWNYCHCAIVPIGHMRCYGTYKCRRMWCS